MSYTSEYYGLATATWSNCHFLTGSTEGIATIEHIMQHIAKVVKKDPVQIRLNNMRSDDNIMPQMVKDLKDSADYDVRKESVDEFNQASWAVFFPA